MPGKTRHMWPVSAAVSSAVGPYRGRPSVQGPRQSIVNDRHLPAEAPREEAEQEKPQCGHEPHDRVDHDEHDGCPPGLVRGTPLGLRWASITLAPSARFFCR